MNGRSPQGAGGSRPGACGFAGHWTSEDSKILTKQARRIVRAVIVQRRLQVWFVINTA